jgi:hypothetical protein
MLWGHSENAVNIHIWIAVCAYLIIAYIKYQFKSTIFINPPPLLLKYVIAH